MQKILAFALFTASTKGITGHTGCELSLCYGIAVGMMIALVLKR